MFSDTGERIGNSSSNLYTLKWTNYQSHLKNGFNELLEDDEMTDVTLACDGEFIKAHKLLLSVCSPYFKRLFKVNQTDKKDTIVIINNVRFKDLQNILRFVYNGEVKMSQADLNTFLMTGQLLQIEGLTALSNDNEDENGTASPKMPHLTPVPGPSTSAFFPTSISSNRATASTNSNNAQTGSMSNSSQPAAKRIRIITSEGSLNPVVVSPTTIFENSCSSSALDEDLSFSVDTDEQDGTHPEVDPLSGDVEVMNDDNIPDDFDSMKDDDEVVILEKTANFIEAPPRIPDEDEIYEGSPAPGPSTSGAAETSPRKSTDGELSSESRRWIEKEVKMETEGYPIATCASAEESTFPLEVSTTNCEICGLKIPTSMMNFHVYESHNIDKKQCPLCLRFFKNRNSLKVHKSTYHRVHGTKTTKKYDHEVFLKRINDTVHEKPVHGPSN